jgi:regulator of protease activity HflC (stomatin/prohibitin superfamily)
MQPSWDRTGVNVEAMTPADLLAHRRSLPRFQRAAIQAGILRRVLVVGILLVGLLWWLLSLPAPAGVVMWQPLLVTYLATLLVLVAAVYSVWWSARWRAQALVESVISATPSDDLLPTVSPSMNAAQPGWRRRLVQRLSSVAALSARYMRTQFNALGAILGVSVFALLALMLVIGNWNTAVISAPSGATSSATFSDTAIATFAGIPLVLLLVVGLLSLAFAMLVVERYYAGNRAKELPEAVVVVCFLRVSMTLSLLLCVALLLVDSERQWPLTLISWLALLPAAIAVELLLRALLTLFSPPHRQAEPELLATSLIAAMWRWPIQPFRHFQDELKERFGVDLRQSWAFAYMRRACLPVAAVLLGIAWLLSGLVEIGIAERGIYERFGAPVAVWQSGLHLGLPWPLGRVQRLEKGVVHELATASAADDSAQPAQIEVETVEDPAPVAANRLWDASHVAEKSQIIASEVVTSAGIRQSFHIVNMDVRFMYRIGLSDEAALKAHYHNADVPALIRSAANRILVRYFASRTLEGVLGDARRQLALDIGQQLQTDLDGLNSGVEIMATVLEAIHPPAAAANAYHSVQAAQINASAIIARERGNAAQTVNLAQVRAGIARDQATAGARETLATAEVAERRFSAEQLAYQQGGKAFLWEQYFAQLVKGLGDASFTLIDHRLANANATIDLRRFALGDSSPVSSTTGSAPVNAAEE